MNWHIFNVIWDMMLLLMYANHFFDAFKDSSIFTRRDVDFIYELAENTTRLILDENLNKDSLAAQV